MFEKIIEVNILYDFYGQLLTGRQRDIFQMYYEDNYSLAEIAEELGISRQGVHNSVKKTEKELHEYEEKLGLAAKFLRAEHALEKIDASIVELISENRENVQLAERLNEIKVIIDQLSDIDL